MRNKLLVTLTAIMLLVSTYIHVPPVVSTPAVVASPLKFYTDYDKLNSIQDYVNTQITVDHFIKTIEGHRNIIIVWNGLGGHLEISENLVKKIQELSRISNIKIVVTAKAISAHAFALCSLENVEIKPYAQIIFHDAIKYGKFHKNKKLFKPCIEKGLLTQEEVDRIIKEELEILIHFDEQGNRSAVFVKDTRLQPDILDLN